MKQASTIRWDSVYQSLNEKGYALMPSILSSDECVQLSGLYIKAALYRNTIDMQRYRFGRGEYKYFNYPLPPAIQEMRTTFYPGLASLANTWMQCLSIDTRFPSNHDDLILQCQANTQNRPTPLILRYEVGGFNTLHQDLYGEVYFPFQLVIVLNQAGRDFEGGEFVMTEQVPRAQSKANVIVPQQGDAVIFTTNFRPVKGSRGYYRATMKHGISEVKSGERFALGVIFHDAA